MKIRRRKSSLKRRRQLSFLRRMKTKSGRKILKNQRKRRHNIKIK